MLKYSKLFVSSTLLFTVPSLALFPQSGLGAVSMQIREIREMSLQTGPLLSYDNVLNLILDLEDGELEKRCNEADLERINYFLANLAAQGILPSETES